MVSRFLRQFRLTLILHFKMFIELGLIPKLMWFENLLELGLPLETREQPPPVELLNLLIISNFFTINYRPSTFEHLRPLPMLVNLEHVATRKTIKLLLTPVLTDHTSLKPIVIAWFLIL